MNDSGIIYDKEFGSAEELLEFLSPRNEIWSKRPADWIFRGQEDANWQLVPSAFREKTWDDYTGIIPMENWKNHTNEWQLFIEFIAVLSFAEFSDRQGLAVPGLDYRWINRREFDLEFNEKIKSVYATEDFFPLPEWRTIFALAQHYGIPTRLLDWTESGKIAAYFAASGAALSLQKKLTEPTDYFTVWAMNIVQVHQLGKPGEIAVHSVRAPWATNPNLQVQRGLFTLSKTPIEKDEEFKEQALDDLIISMCKTDGVNNIEMPIICKLQLPVREASNVLKMLDYEGINHSSIYPGYYGVVKYLKETRYYTLDRMASIFNR